MMDTLPKVLFDGLYAHCKYGLVLPSFSDALVSSSSGTISGWSFLDDVCRTLAAKESPARIEYLEGFARSVLYLQRTDKLVPVECIIFAMLEIAFRFRSESNPLIAQIKRIQDWEQFRGNDLLIKRVSERMQLLRFGSLRTGDDLSFVAIGE